MTTLVALLALLGGAALVSRLVRSVLRLVLRTAEITASEGLAEISARRGDLTTLAERREEEAAARGRRRRDVLLGLAWLLWLVVPALSTWTREAYALAAPLWLLPAAPVRPRE